MQGAIPPIPHMPSRHVHENFSFVLLSVIGMFIVAYNMSNVMGGANAALSVNIFTLLKH
jgi:hypothetical protein